MSRTADFRTFMTENQFDWDSFLRATLTYVRRTNRRVYDGFEWPDRVAPPPEEHDLFIDLDDKMNEIISALVDLRNPPDSLVRPSRRRNDLRWNDATSLATYATQCYTQYTQQKSSPKIYREFLTCMIAMNYAQSTEALKQLSITAGAQMAAGKEQLKRLRATVARATHDRLTRIGNRCCTLMDIFRGIAGLSILSIHNLKVIDKMTVYDFNQFADHLRAQVRENGNVVQEIIRTNLHVRLLYYHGTDFPPDVRPYLGLRH